MASAVLASQNEPYWGDRKVYMRQYNNAPTITTNNDQKTSAIHFNPNPFPYPNPTPKALIKSAKPVLIHDAGPFRQRETCPAPRKTTLSSGQTSAPKASSSHGQYVRYDLGTFTRRELKEVRRRLISELEQVRSLKFRLETLNQDTRPVYPHHAPQTSTIRPPPPLPLHLPTTTPTTSAIHPSSATTSNPPVLKKSHQTKRKTPGSHGSKRSNPFSRDLNSNPKRTSMDPLAEKMLSSMMKRCGQILSKLMKLKFAWVFNNPVDVAGLKLFDYYQIIKKPMDLGTVKVNLETDVYKSPMDFATDVRLTFENAMAYNPKQHEVHIWAQSMLAKFNEMFSPAYRKFEEEKIRVCGQSPEPVVHAHPVVVESVPASEPVVVEASLKERVVMRKPKAREVNKREMSFEEKKKLGKELEELPPEKMMQLLSIVRKRNGDLEQNGDEIELDMETMDTETLWELDRFVNNYRKMISKMKREGGVGELMYSNSPATLPVSDLRANNKDGANESEMMDFGQKGGGGEEDVDIGEEMPVGNYPPVEIEKDVKVTAYASGRSATSGSSSSGSDSSSASGSGSGSSSGCDSDADSVQSPYVEKQVLELV